MLHPNLFCMLRDELSDKAWIPEFTGDAQVFAAAHQSVRLAALDCGGDAFWRKVVLFAAGDGDESVRGGISCCFYTQVGRGGYVDLPSATRAYSLVTAFAVTMVSPLGARPQAPGPNALFNILRYLISGR